MDRLDVMRLFVRVVEAASFSKAARAEGVVQSTVSKQIAALESRLGAQLLRRTSRGLSLTEADPIQPVEIFQARHIALDGSHIASDPGPGLLPLVQPDGQMPRNRRQ